MREEGPVTRRGRAHSDETSRAQRGAIAARVLLALCTATTVTLMVAGPLAYQAHEARDPAVVQTHDPRLPSTTTTIPRRAPAQVAGASATAPEPPAGDPSPTSTTTTAPPRPGPTSPPDLDLPPTTGAPDPPTTTVPGPGAVVVPPPTSAPQQPAPSTTTTLPAPNPGGLAWARRWSEGVQLEPLQGAVVDGRICIVFSAPDVARVAFYLDDPTASKGPFNVGLRSPFSLVRGPNDVLPGTLDTSDMASGMHSVRADIVWADGREETRLASFTVSR